MDLKIALHNIVLAHLAAKRKDLSAEILALQKHLNDSTDLISPQCGKHWSLRQLHILPLSTGHEGWKMSYPELAKLLQVKEKSLRHALSVSKGQLTRNVRLPNSRHAVPCVIERI